MIPATLQALWMLLVAYMEAKSDGMKIRGGLPIDHMGNWMMRAGCAVLTSAALAVHGGSWVMFAGLLVLSVGAFTPAFRYLLNRERGLPFDYISLSNAYDSAFIAVAGVNGGILAFTIEALLLIAGGIICYQ